MFRKNSPGLKAMVDGLLKKYPAGSAERNEIIQEYLKTAKWVTNATSVHELEKFRRTVELFRKYASKYSMDYLLMMAQGYQESQLDQTAPSPRGRGWHHANHACHRQRDGRGRHPSG